MPLAEIVKECNLYIQALTAGPASKTLGLEEKTTKLIPTIAQRKCFVARRLDIPTSSEAALKDDLACWEVENFNILELPNIKDARTRREQRKLVSQKLHKLAKLLSCIREVLSSSKK